MTRKVREDDKQIDASGNKNLEGKFEEIKEKINEACVV